MLSIWFVCAVTGERRWQDLPRPEVESYSLIHSIASTIALIDDLTLLGETVAKRAEYRGDVRPAPQKWRVRWHPVYQRSVHFQ